MSRSTNDILIDQLLLKPVRLTNVPIDEQETHLLETHTSTSIPASQFPRFLEYKAPPGSSPLEMLFSCVLSFRQKHRHFPVMLFVDSETERQLIQQHWIVFGQPYTSCFNFGLNWKTVRPIQVRNEKMLPDLFAMALDGKIARDYVLAIGEC